ncbi:uncharacterized protein MONBRDRAFT_32442 [Monosiga brevicollis MX1]|uniref:Glutathione transferase n=1 Tax=Monosiga brevicollis TaxID=81824 RepID=A9UZI9_MONBE|nr:uncharacterized protein MONBRDRAFT_32442 [Monosiga brevicollis MX1]EDQ89377.1 predicted protein [Monosiga brevicollis MX1]|eukprot:XP_001745953.1 hypothetical protein [Monosiga brevicollis MX1]
MFTGRRGEGDTAARHNKSTQQQSAPPMEYDQNARAPHHNGGTGRKTFKQGTLPPVEDQVTDALSVTDPLTHWLTDPGCRYLHTQSDDQKSVVNNSYANQQQQLLSQVQHKTSIKCNNFIYLYKCFNNINTESRGNPFSEPSLSLENGKNPYKPEKMEKTVEVETASSGQSDGIKLYWCPKTRAVRMAWMLEELGQPYERIKIDIRDETSQSRNDRAFREASPMGKVPALRHGPIKLWDSGAMCLYLADAFPEAGLAVAPSDPRRGQYLQWTLFTNSVLEPAMTERIAGMEPHPSSHGHGSFDQMITTLEQALQQGPWLLGEQFTSADVLVGTGISFMIQFGVLKEPSTVLTDYVARCSARPACQRAHAFESE